MTDPGKAVVSRRPRAAMRWIMAALYVTAVWWALFCAGLVDWPRGKQARAGARGSSR